MCVLTRATGVASIWFTRMTTACGAISTCVSTSRPAITNSHSSVKSIGHCMIPGYLALNGRHMQMPFLTPLAQAKLLVCSVAGLEAAHVKLLTCRHLQVTYSTANIEFPLVNEGKEECKAIL